MNRDIQEKYRELNKFAHDTCGIILPPQINHRALDIIAELRTTLESAKIMVLCDMLTDELTGTDTNGFIIK